MGNILKLKIQHEGPISSLLSETGEDLPVRVCIFACGQSAGAGKSFQGRLGLSAPPGLTYLLASFLTSAHPFLLELANLGAGNVLFYCGTFSEQTSYTGKTHFQI